MNKNRIVGAIMIAVSIFAMISFTYGIVNSFTIHNTGNVQMVKAFWDQSYNQEVTTIDWGSVIPDSVQNRTIYVKNFGAKTVNLTLTTSNWSPANAVSHIDVTWDLEGENIASGMTLQAIVFLTVNASIVSTSIGSFSFDLLFTEHWT